MKIPNFLKDKNLFLLIYKLLYDVLFLTLISFAGMLVFEGLLPEFVSTRISFTNTILLILVVTGAIGFLGHRLDIAYEPPTSRKNFLLPVLTAFSFLLIGNSMLKFVLWENMLISLIALSLMFILYQLIFTSSKKVHIHIPYFTRKKH